MLISRAECKNWDIARGDSCGMGRLPDGEPKLGSTGQCSCLASNKTEEVTGRWVFQAGSLQETLTLGNVKRV